MYDKLMLKLKENYEVLESESEIPTIWYRGTEEFPKNVQTRSFSRFAYYQGAKPDKIKEEIPEEIVKLYNDGKIDTINYLYPGGSWSIKRTYQGMSNFGFGIYFATSIDWAKRYGNYITCARVSPSYVLRIKWDERDIEGTVANRVMTFVRKNGGQRLGDQAKFFYKAIKSIDRKKKALFVETSNDSGTLSGQLIIFDPSIISLIATFNFKEELTEGTDYKGEHEAPDKDNGSPMSNVIGTYPEDFYSSTGYQHYAQSEEIGGFEAYSIVKSCFKRPNKAVMVYRAVPKEIKGSSINKGNWVTVSKEYAKNHGVNNLNNKFKIISKVVSSRDLFTDGNSIVEWGYDPQLADPTESKKSRLRYRIGAINRILNGAKIIGINKEPNDIYFNTSNEELLKIMQDADRNLKELENDKK
jgi:hypothetical protein